MSTLFKGLAETHRTALSPNNNKAGDGEVFIAQVLDVVKNGRSAEGITLADAPELVGAIRFSKATANKKLESEATNLAYPLDRSCYRLPMIGEQVLVVRRGQGYYYFAVVSSFASMTVNIDPNLFLNAFESAGGPAIAVDPNAERDRFNARNDFDEATVFTSSSLFSRVREGETILEGRMGGVIKLTHTITKEGVWDAEKQIVNLGQSTDGDPMLVMRSNIRRKLASNLQYKSNDAVDQISNLTDPTTAAATAKTIVQNPSDQAKLSSIAAQIASSNAKQARGEAGLTQIQKDQLLSEANQIAGKEYGLEDDDINEDGSSFYLTTTQVVPLKINSSVSMSSWAVELTESDTPVTTDSHGDYATLQEFFPDRYDPDQQVGINVTGISVMQSAGSSFSSAGPADGTNGRLPDSALMPVGIGKHRLAIEAAQAFIRMADAAKAEGITPRLTDSYRTFEEQDALFDWDLYVATGGNRTDTAANFNRNTKRRKKGTNGVVGAAFPGTSNHGKGIAIDADGEPFKRFIRNRGVEFGWSWAEGRKAAGGETWHFTYLPNEKETWPTTNGDSMGSS